MRLVSPVRLVPATTADREMAERLRQKKTRIVGARAGMETLQGQKVTGTASKTREASGGYKQLIKESQEKIQS